MTQPIPPTWLDAYFRSGYVAIKVNGTLLPPEFILDFQGTVVSGNDDPLNSQTVITISGTGGGGTLIVEANGSAITQRAILDLDGLSYTDDSVGGRMRFSADSPAPSGTVSAGHTIGASETLIEFVGGTYAFNCGNLVVGRLYRLLHVGAPFLETTAVSISGAPGGANIENPDNRSASLSASQPLGVSWGAPYVLCWDGSILRAWRGG